MGLDFGALLRGGANISSGYQQGQQAAAQRQEEARRRALQEALLGSQTRNQESLIADRDRRFERQQGLDAAPVVPDPADLEAAEFARNREARAVDTAARQRRSEEQDAALGKISRWFEIKNAEGEPSFPESVMASELRRAHPDWEPGAAEGLINQVKTANATEARAVNRGRGAGLSLSPALQAELGVVGGGAQTPPSTATQPSAAGEWLGGGQDQGAKAQLEAAVRAAGRSPEETARALERIAGMSEQDAAARINR